jgi:hypothetical protein
MSFYSYGILARVLRNRERVTFITIFWVLMVIIVTFRSLILGNRIRFILNDSVDVEIQHMINAFHIGYFVAIALVECASAFFLLRKFASAKSTSVEAARNWGLFSYLMRSTEIRLTLLALIGITRAVTYSFQDAAQSATSIASQLDRFAYTLECLFPVVLL